MERSQDFDADEFEIMKYSLGLIMMLMIAIYMTASTKNREERMYVLMWSVATIGGVIAWYISSGLIVPKYLDTPNLTPLGRNALVG